MRDLSTSRCTDAPEPGCCVGCTLFSELIYIKAAVGCVSLMKGWIFALHLD